MDCRAEVTVLVIISDSVISSTDDLIYIYIK